ncbi:MAG TPA: hypothetical protein DCY88_06940 [Cyanobacteria bacterium UBA11372]|nr:hypothetical protein [Cyanobacteria bacterium UBA11372]
MGIMLQSPDTLEFIVAYSPTPESRTSKNTRWGLRAICLGHEFRWCSSKNLFFSPGKAFASNGISPGICFNEKLDIANCG